MAGSVLGAPEFSRIGSNLADWLTRESVLYNGDREVARGSGTFMPSKAALTTALGYE